MYTDTFTKVPPYNDVYILLEVHGLRPRLEEIDESCCSLYLHVCGILFKLWNFHRSCVFVFYRFLPYLCHMRVIEGSLTGPLTKKEPHDMSLNRSQNLRWLIFSGTSGNMLVKRHFSWVEPYKSLNQTINSFNKSIIHRVIILHWRLWVNPLLSKQHQGSKIFFYARHHREGSDCGGTTKKGAPARHLVDFVKWWHFSSADWDMNGSMHTYT